ncbi:MAG: acetyl-CoA C-acetyltransferase [Candidatus Saliniplasma sp.]
MKEAVIVDGVRTPQGKFGGSLKHKTPSELGRVVIKGLFGRLGAKPALSKAQKAYSPKKFKDKGLSEVESEYADWDDGLLDLDIDEVIMGNVLQGGQGQNPARQSAVISGIPTEVPAFTVNKVCASGLKSVELAARKIMAGEADSIIAGGMENMSSAPYLLPKARWGYRMNVDGKGEVTDMMVKDGLYEIFYDCHMGVTAENLAEAYSISREEQDRLSVESQNRAQKALKNGVFQNEIVPVPLRDGMFDKDETPRETSLEALEKLPPVFKKDGTVTAGNASSISDGAAALMITSREYAEENGLNIMASILKSTSGGLDPKYMGLGPVVSTNKLFDEVEYSEDDVDIIEENEAFAAQILAVMEEMDSPKYGIGMSEPGSERINPYGSGISLGHPIGCTGARIVVTLVHEMVRSKEHLGLASLCIGGGMGMSMLIERE